MIMIIFRGTDGDTEPVKCECEEFGWPNSCCPADGKEEKQFTNTHYKTEKEAWKSITDSVEAGKEINSRYAEMWIKEKWDALDKVIKQLKDDQKEYGRVMNNPKNPYKINNQ